MSQTATPITLKSPRILFCEASIPSLFTGLKTVTRRPATFAGEIPEFWGYEGDERTLYHWSTMLSWGSEDGEPVTLEDVAERPHLFCRFGGPGSIITGMERWYTDKKYDDIPPRELPDDAPLWFPVFDLPEKPKWAGKLRSPLFLPRRFSRLRLKIKDLRLERLFDITNEDAISEGISGHDITYYMSHTPPDHLWTWEPEPRFPHLYHTPREAYLAWYDALHGTHCREFSYSSVVSQVLLRDAVRNPWVWRIAFELIWPQEGE